MIFETLSDCSKNREWGGGRSGGKKGEREEERKKEMKEEKE